MSTDGTACPHCGAPKVAGPECPRCGVIYARARPISVRAAGGVPAEMPSNEGLAAAEAPSDAGWNAPMQDARAERRIRLFAIPGALALATLVTAGGIPRALARIACSMWLHELGHAAVAWWCGFAAFPGPWRTFVAEERGFGAPIVLFAALAGLGVAGWRRGRRRITALAVGLVVLQFTGTLLVRPAVARSLVTFGGDAGALVLGSALMATIFARPDGALGRGWLRWGFLAIGALSFADVTRTWWVARGDVAEIPYGENEGVGPSDASVLGDSYGWGPGELVQRHLAVAVLCLVALATATVVLALRDRPAGRGRR